MGVVSEYTQYFFSRGVTSSYGRGAEISQDGGGTNPLGQHVLVVILVFEKVDPRLSAVRKKGTH